MPAAKKKSKSKLINLVPEEGFASTTSGRILLWTLSTFRVVLIITELVVIGAFISRFWLDAKNTDLTEQVNEVKNTIVSLEPFEENFKDVQNRLQIFDSYIQNKDKINSSLKTVVSYKPQGVSFQEINAGLDQISINATAVSEIQIQQYYVNLKASNKFENIRLSNISINKENSSLNFALTADVKTEI